MECLHVVFLFQSLMGLTEININMFQRINFKTIDSAKAQRFAGNPVLQKIACKIRIRTANRFLFFFLFSISLIWNLFGRMKEMKDTNKKKTNKQINKPGTNTKPIDKEIIQVRGKKLIFCLQI